MQSNRGRGLRPLSPTNKSAVGRGLTNYGTKSDVASEKRGNTYERVDRSLDYES